MRKPIHGYLLIAPIMLYSLNDVTTFMDQMLLVALAVLVGAVELILAASGRKVPEMPKVNKPSRPRPQRSAGKAGAR